MFLISVTLHSHLPTIPLRFKPAKKKALASDGNSIATSHQVTLCEKILFY